MDVVLVSSGAVALGVAAFLMHLLRWSITPPLLGLTVGVLIGPHVLDAFSIPGDEQLAVMRVAARLLLAVALMAVGLRYPTNQMRTHVREVTVLVVLVLPAMAAVLALGGSWVLGLPLGAALVLGAVLSPTDPVLASGIVSGPYAERDVPERDRQILSLESGVNDGLAMPLVIIAVAWALDRSMPAEVGRATYEVLAGAATGAVVGYLAARGMQWAKSRRDEMPANVRELYTLVLAAFVLGLSGLMNADGLLSVFVAGLMHNHVVTGSDRRSELGIDETLNHFLVVPVFVLFGAVLPWSEWAALGWSGPLFVLAALLLRRLPFLLLLRRPLRSSWTEATWMGWFGPIGVAALYYLGHAHHEGVTNPDIWAAGSLVIAASTVVHGLTTGLGRLAFQRS